MISDRENAEQPAWLYLLKPMERAWREGELMKGFDPDPHLEGKLRNAGRWPLQSTRQSPPDLERR